MKRLVISSILLFACGDDQEAGTPDASVSCLQDSRVDQFSPGVRVSAEDGVVVAVVTAAPAVPTRFGNTWSVQIYDAQEQALETSALVVEPFMPDHGHGTPQPPLPVPAVELGGFDMGPFDLWMPGVWELRFSVMHQGQTSLAVLTLCIEE